MAIQTIAAIKAFFNTGDRPTETQFSDTIDSLSGTVVSANDTTPGVLNGKMVAGPNITLTENNDGANETLTIDTKSRGCYAIRTSDQTIPSGVDTDVVWQGEIYDTDNFHSAALNQQRFTIPANVSVVRLAGQVRWAGIAAGIADRGIRITQYNSSDVLVDSRSVSETTVPTTSNEWDHQVITPPLEVSSGDYFIMTALNSHASSQDIHFEACWLSLQVIK